VITKKTKGSRRKKKTTKAGYGASLLSKTKSSRKKRAPGRKKVRGMLKRYSNKR